MCRRFFVAKRKAKFFFVKFLFITINYASNEEIKANVICSKCIINEKKTKHNVIFCILKR